MTSAAGNRKPSVSVLMSCYNASRWLHEAIDSVLAQTFEDFEFILVDDGSTDETWNIIQSYRDRDHRIVAVSKKNTGLADSLNVGIAQARGVWIARLDADDLCEPTRLEEQLSFVCSHRGVVLLGSGFVEIDEHGRELKKHQYPSDHRKLVRHLERWQKFFPHSSAFYSVDVARQVGGYNPRICRAEDRRLWLDLASRGQIASLAASLVKIRKHSAQISRDNNGKRQFCDGMAATVCYFLQKAGCKDPSMEKSAGEWSMFLTWLENRMVEAGAFEKRKAWVDARTEYFSSKNMMVGGLRFARHLLGSGYASALVWEEFFGSSFPRRMAREWMARWPSE